MITQTEMSHKLIWGDAQEAAPACSPEQDVAYAAGELSRKESFLWFGHHLRAVIDEQVQDGATHIDAPDAILTALGRCMVPLGAEFGWPTWRVAELLMAGAQQLNADHARAYGVALSGGRS